MFNKARKESEPRVADIYIRRLYYLQKKGRTMEFLHDMLTNEKVYFDQDSLDTVISILKSRGLIQKAMGNASFGYNNKRTSLFRRVLFRWKKEQLDLNSINILEVFSNLEMSIDLYELTKKGIHFVAEGQVIDEERKGRRKQRLNKWVERVITFIMGISSTLAVQWFSRLLENP